MFHETRRASQTAPTTAASLPPSLPARREPTDHCKQRDCRPHFPPPKLNALPADHKSLDWALVELRRNYHCPSSILLLRHAKHSARDKRGRKPLTPRLASLITEPLHTPVVDVPPVRPPVRVLPLAGRTTHYLEIVHLVHHAELGHGFFPARAAAAGAARWYLR